MATQVKVPSVGESISSGIIAAWHANDGDYVKQDQVIYELETDKVTSEATAPVSGILKILEAEGEEVEVGQEVAQIDESATAPSEKDPVAKDSEVSSVPAASNVEEAPPSPDEAYPPSVVRLAAESGIDPSSISGSGKGNRVTKEDMENEIAKASQKTLSTSAPRAPSKNKNTPAEENERFIKKPMTPLRRKIAERLVQSQQNAAILTTFNEVDMSAIIKLRKSHQDSFVKKYGCKLGFMSFFVKAVVHALQTVPQLNAQIAGNAVIENKFYDIGVAVGTEKGLVVPVLRDCDQLSFADIEQTIIGYAKKAREGKITIDDMQGGVFTITNGGIYGSMMSTPIINPPQSGILGMHSITERPVAINGEVVIRPMMYLAVSYDHRLVDGKEAVTFLVNIKNAIEDPSRLLFGI